MSNVLKMFEIRMLSNMNANFITSLLNNNLSLYFKNEYTGVVYLCVMICMQN